MRTRPLFLTLRHLSRLCVLLLAFAIVLATVFTPACGVGQPTVTPVQGFTSVTVLLSGTLNDQLSKVIVALGSISLTSQSGKTVNLYTPSQSNGATPGYEFVHLNGIAEPLTTVVIAQGVYNSATVTITSGSYMSCVLANPPGNPDSLEVFVNTPFTLVAGPTTPVTVNMPTPVTINGYAMGITLNMLLPQSAFSACTNYGSVSVLPTFNLIPVTFSAQPTNAENGKETNLEGQISFVNSANNSFTMVLSDGQTLSVKSNGSTVYQGVKGFSALTAGTFVDMDAAIQSDGSQLATRIAVENNNITDLTVATGPVFEATPSAQIVSVLVRQEQGYLGPASPPQI